MSNLTEFHTTLIIEYNKDVNLYFARADDPLKQIINHNLNEQYDSFINNKEIKDFVPGSDRIKDNPVNTLFRIPNYNLPPFMDAVNEKGLLNTAKTEAVRNLYIKRGTVKAAAVFTTYTNTNLLLFQRFRFSNRMVLDENKVSMTFDTRSSSFKQFKGSLLTLSNSINAVYVPSSNNLIFKSFDDVNYILQLEEYFRPISIPKIKQFLDDDMFYISSEGADELLQDLSYQLATRFYIADTQPPTKYILNKFTAEQISNVSKDLRIKGLDIELTPSKDQIVFPLEKEKAHLFLRFLNEDFFKGAFTERTYSTIDKTSEI